MRIHALVAVTVLLSACARPVLDSNVDHGPITPIAVPVVLQYRPVSGVTGHSVWETSTPDGKRERGEVRWHQNISSIGSQTVWDYQITELETDAGKWWSERPPLVQVRALVSNRGVVTDFEIDFPYDRQRGAKDIPEKGTDK